MPEGHRDKRLPPEAWPWYALCYPGGKHAGVVTGEGSRGKHPAADTVAKFYEGHGWGSSQGATLRP